MPEMQNAVRLAQEQVRHEHAAIADILAHKILVRPSFCRYKLLCKLFNNGLVFLIFY
jgi:hypothetical protein